MRKTNPLTKLRVYPQVSAVFGSGSIRINADSIHPKQRHCMSQHRRCSVFLFWCFGAAWHFALPRQKLHRTVTFAVLAMTNCSSTAMHLAERLISFSQMVGKIQGKHHVVPPAHVRKLIPYHHLPARSVAMICNVFWIVGKHDERDKGFLR
jgi:hypothetical protein